MTNRTTSAVQDTLNALSKVEEEEMARLVQEVSVNIPVAKPAYFSHDVCYCYITISVGERK